MRKLVMYIKDLNFRVEFLMYAEAHYCKDFFKKYKGKRWVETRRTIEETLRRAFLVQHSALISDLKYWHEEDFGIFKYEFKIAGTNQSPKGAGNRAIFSVDNNTGRIEVLLVYAKGHCGKKQSETSWIMEHAKAAHKRLKKLLKS